MKSNLAIEINKSIVNVYWNIGRIIVSNENENNNRLEYGKEVLKELSQELTKYLGKGYSVSNLKYMRLFYKTYPNLDKVGFCDDGYTDIVEVKNKKFYIGLRFHPESLYEIDENINNIFKAFLEECRKQV